MVAACDRGTEGLSPAEAAPAPLLVLVWLGLDPERER